MLDTFQLSETKTTPFQGGHRPNGSRLANTNRDVISKDGHCVLRPQGGSTITFTAIWPIPSSKEGRKWHKKHSSLQYHYTLQREILSHSETQNILLKLFISVPVHILPKWNIYGDFSKELKHDWYKYWPSGGTPTQLSKVPARQPMR